MERLVTYVIANRGIRALRLEVFPNEPPTNQLGLRAA